MTRDNPRERAVLDAAEPLGAQVADTILVCGRVGPHGQTGHTTYSKKLLRLGGRPHTRSQRMILGNGLRVDVGKSRLLRPAIDRNRSRQRASLFCSLLWFLQELRS